MQYGHFDDKRREYVITSPLTPLPWINYLGSDDFFALVSNTAGGYAFYKDARMRRLTRFRYNNLPLDNDGFHIYIKEGRSVWNPGFRPCGAKVSRYECRHGMGYTVIHAEKNRLAATQEMFVPKNDNILLTRVTLHNKSAEAKSVELFSFVEFCLWEANDDATNFQRNYSTGEVEVEGSSIFHKTEFRERRNHYAVFSVNRKIAGFDTNRDAFMGVYGSPAAPEAVKAGHCTNSIAHGWQPVGAHELHFELQPGESDSVIFALAYVEVDPEEKFVGPQVINKEPAKALLKKYNTDKKFDAALEKLHKFWDELLSHYQVTTENEKVDRAVNIWNAYQCMVTFNMSRSASYFESGIGRGMGFRDSCQDLLGFVHMIPERARERILDIAATQKANGGAYHQYQPLTKKGNSAVGDGFNDDPLWLIACTDAYIRETGDFGILDEIVDFDNQKELAAPLLEHLRRSFNYTLEHLGPHGLPLIGRADWNDCLNLNFHPTSPDVPFQTGGSAEGLVAESIFIAGMFVKYGRAYEAILNHLDLKDEAQAAEEAVAQMEETVMRSGWDGEWFLRAYDGEGRKLGSHECEEGKIFIEPQGMCVMAGLGIESGDAQKAMDAVEKYLECDYGIVLVNPCYTKYSQSLGEISTYPGGYKENAGVFCHNNPWVIWAETMLGHGDRAFALYKKISPIFLEHMSEIHRTEPYVFCQMVSGKDAPVKGEGKNSWLTGTAAWTYTALSQAILGVKPDYDGLLLDPCVPQSVKSYQVERLYRSARYHITVRNESGEGHGVKALKVNGNEVPYGPIAAKPGKDIDVEVIL